MFFHQRFIPGLAIASKVIGDEQSREVAVIDPTLMRTTTSASRRTRGCASRTSSRLTSTPIV